MYQIMADAPKLTAEQIYAKRGWELLAPMDTNGDGRLVEAEVGKGSLKLSPQELDEVRTLLKWVEDVRVHSRHNHGNPDRPIDPAIKRDLTAPVDEKEVKAVSNYVIYYDDLIREEFAYFIRQQEKKVKDKIITPKEMNEKIATYSQQLGALDSNQSKSITIGELMVNNDGNSSIRPSEIKALAEPVKVK